MKSVTNVNEVFEAIKIEFPDLAAHVCQSDNDLPSFTLNNLERSFESLPAYFAGRRRGENLVAEYYGAGLAKRCLEELLAAGYKIEISGIYL